MAHSLPGTGGPPDAAPPTVPLRVAFLLTALAVLGTTGARAQTAAPGATRSLDVTPERSVESVVLSLDPSGPPDLTPTQLLFTCITAFGCFTDTEDNTGLGFVDVHIANIGGATSLPSRLEIRDSASRDSVTEGSPVLATVAVPAIEGGGSVRVGTTNQDQPGLNALGESDREGRYAWVIVDVDDESGQVNRSNDRLLNSLLGGGGPPDLIPRNLTVVPASASQIEGVDFTFDVSNEGGSRSNPSRVNVRLSASSEDVTGADPLLDTIELPALESGQRVTLRDNCAALPLEAGPCPLTIPSDVPPGDYYVWVIVDVDGTAGQENGDNDKASVPITVGTTEPQGTAGTTVITHGFSNPLPDILADPFGPFDDGLGFDQNWAITMAEAILERAPHGGRIWIVNDHSIEAHPFDFVPSNSEGEQVVVFDWLAESVYDEFGYAEGAANALFAALLEGAGDGKWSLDQLHMIGHSRGTVVLSETAQRIEVARRRGDVAPAGIEIDGAIHFTLLDPHPWDNRPSDNIGDPSTAEDYDVNGTAIDSGVVCWSNIVFADIYWHIGGSPEDLNGLSTAPGCAGFAQDVSTDLSDLAGMTHGGVHAWYHGTIDRDAENDRAKPEAQEIEPEGSWYPVAGAGLLSDRRAGGFNLARSVAESGDVFNLALEGQLNPLFDGTYDPFVLHNGSFEKGRRFGPFLLMAASKRGMSGWLHQGGGGNGRRVSRIGNSMLEIVSTGSRHTSGTTWVPQGADRLTFRVRDVTPARDARLNVYAEGIGTTQEIIGRVDLSFAAAGPQHAVIPPSRRGTAQRFTFEVEGTALFLPPRVRIDDVGFSTLPAYLAAYVSIPVVSAARRSRAGGEDAPAVALYAYDAEGNRAGVSADGETVTEIPGSHARIDQEDGAFNLSVTVPPGSDYRFEVVAAEALEGADVLVEKVESDGDLSSATFRGVDLASNGTARVSVSSVDDRLELDIDSDGDGSTDEQRVPTETERTVYVAASASSGGSIEPSGRLSVRAGTDIAFALTPDDGFYLTDLLVNGESVGPVASYTLEAVADDQEVTAVFRDTPPESVACAAGLPLGIGAFDADGDHPAHGEYAEIISGATAPTDLSTCSLVAFNPFTERVTFSTTPDALVLDRIVMATRNGDVALPEDALPDGPGAIALVEGAAPVGATVRSVLGRVVAAVVYINDETVFGRSGYSAARTASASGDLASLLAALRAELPDKIALDLAGPNPVRRSGAVAVALPEGGAVRVSVFDLLGREVSRLVDGDLPAGRHTVALDAAGLPSGVYVVRLVAGSGLRTVRVTVAR